MNTTVAFQSAISIVIDYSLNYIYRLKSFRTLNPSFSLMLQTSYVHLLQQSLYDTTENHLSLDFLLQLPLFLCVLVSIYHYINNVGGSSITNFMHGVMMGYLRRSTGFISYLCGLCLFDAFNKG